MEGELNVREREEARTRSGQKPREMSPKSLANLTAKGKGRPKGVPNKVNKTIREAVLESVQDGACHPEGLAGWLIERARGGIEDRKIYAAVVSRVIPIEITGEGGGAIKVDLGWLAGRKIGNDVVDITPTTQTLEDAAPARLPTDFQSEQPNIAGGRVEAKPGDGDA